MYCGDLKVKEVQKGRDTYIYICMYVWLTHIYMIYMIIYIYGYIYGYMV